MKYLSIILIVLLTGCVTQKRCLSKFPPTITHDTVYEVGTIFFGDKVVEVKIPGDTVYAESSWNDDFVWTTLPEGTTPPDVTVEHRVERIRADVPLAYSEAWVENNTLKMMLVQKDSILEFKLDSVKQFSVDTISISVVEYIDRVVPPKMFTFFKSGFWVLLGLIIIIIILAFVFIKMK